MALHVSWEHELQEQFSLLSATSVEVENKCEIDISQSGSTTNAYLLHLCDEVLILILRELDPMSLLRIGSTCRSLFRVSSCNSLWTQHFQVGSSQFRTSCTPLSGYCFVSKPSLVISQASFGVPFPTATCSASAKNAFCLLFMWRALFRNLHCNRSLQEKLFAEIPNPPHKYWIQWLVLEENVPLPSVRLPCIEIEPLWGVDQDVLETKIKGMVTLDHFGGVAV